MTLIDIRACGCTYVQPELWLYVCNVQPEVIDSRSKPQQDCRQTICYAGIFRIVPQTAFQLTWRFRKNFLLTHKFKTA